MGEIRVKIEEDEYAKKKEPSSQFIGVSYEMNTTKWRAQRHSKIEKNIINYGRYENEETAARASDTLAKKLMANGEKAHKLNFPYDDTEVFPEQKKETSSQFIGVVYEMNKSKWHAQRYSKLEKKTINNGSYENEETAARASDTLARKLMENGEKAHTLNFPYDDTEVFPEQKKTSSQFIGVKYEVNTSKWRPQRYSRLEKKIINNGNYENEETAARASDTLARKLMNNGEKAHKLNFPYDDTDVFPNRARKRKRPQHEDLDYM